jgi:hypothetical protein
MGHNSAAQQLVFLFSQRAELNNKHADMCETSTEKIVFSKTKQSSQNYLGEILS